MMIDNDNNIKSKNSAFRSERDEDVFFTGIFSQLVFHLKPYYLSLVISVIYWIISKLLLLYLDQPEKAFGFTALNLLLFVTISLAPLIFLIYVIYLTFLVKPESLIRYLKEKFATKKNFTLILKSCTVLAFLLFFIAGALNIKSTIPHLIPFNYDVLFSEIDEMIHVNHPWTFFVELYDHPIIIGILSDFYTLWFFVFYGVIIWRITKEDQTDISLQFLLSFILSWIIIGNICALLMSSAGPCYFLEVVGRDDYLPLMAKLSQSDQIFPIIALDIQNMVWQNYIEGSPEPIKSISAMPSMHVSLAFLWYLLSRHSGRLLSITFFLFFIITLAGSVILAWHYAIDGYVAIILTWIIWWAVGRFIVKPNSDK